MFEKTIYTIPPFDKRSKEPSKDYGIGSLIVVFVLKGEKGAVTFELDTGAYSPAITEELYVRHFPYPHIPRGRGVSFHSRTKWWKGQKLTTRECKILNRKCYLDCNWLAGREAFTAYLKGGDEAVWKLLELAYYNRLEKK